MDSVSPYNLIDNIQIFLKTSNGEKPVDGAAAIYLLTPEKKDYNQTIYHIGLEYNVRQLAKTCFIALKALENWENLGQEIARIHATLGTRSIEVLILQGHASPELIVLGAHVYQASEVSVTDFQLLAPTATIILPVCEAGQILAKKIAAVQERQVIASTEPVSGSAPVLFQESRSKSYLMGSCNAKLFKKTIYGIQETAVDLEDIQKVYQERVVWLKTKVPERTAQYLLGWHYMNGIGVEMSRTEALKWYLESATQGLAEAQTQIGIWYITGPDVEQSIEKAVDWFTKAAEQGHSNAQNNLGYYYEHGYGVQQSFDTALEWYTKAAVQGNETARGNLKRLQERLTPLCFLV